MKVLARFLFTFIVIQLFECCATDENKELKKINHDALTMSNKSKESGTRTVGSGKMTMKRQKTNICNYVEVLSNDVCSYKLYARDLFCFSSSTQKVCHVKIRSGPRIRCSQNRNISRLETDKVEILNMETFADTLAKQADNACTVMLFYATWCPFSMKLSPNYNALGRIYNNLDTFAVDVVWQSNSFMTRYGTVAVPTILIFEGGQIFARYSSPNRTLPSLIDFVSKNTNLSIPIQMASNSESQKEIDLPKTYPSTMEADFVGPVPTQLNEATNWGLYGCFTFLMLFSIQQIISHKLYLKILPALHFL